MQFEWSIPSQGYVRRGHVESLREGREAAAQWMREHGSSAFVAEKETEFARVEHAWWNQAEGVFVQADHEGAEPVTVVQIPV